MPGVYQWNSWFVWLTPSKVGFVELAIRKKIRTGTNNTPSNLSAMSRLCCTQSHSAILHLILPHPILSYHTPSYPTTLFVVAKERSIEHVCIALCFIIVHTLPCSTTYPTMPCSLLQLRKGTKNTLLITVISLTRELIQPVYKVIQFSQKQFYNQRLSSADHTYRQCSSLWSQGSYHTVKNFCAKCSLVPPKDAMPPNFAEKTPNKTSKFAKVFYLKSFPLYSM